MFLKAGLAVLTGSLLLALWHPAALVIFGLATVAVVIYVFSREV